MNRSKVESVDVDQSLFGRVLGFGTVVVRGTGGSLEPIRLVARSVRLSEPHHRRIKASPPPP